MKCIYSPCLSFQQQQHIFVLFCFVFVTLVFLPWFPGQIQSQQTLMVPNLGNTVLRQKDHRLARKSPKVRDVKHISCHLQRKGGAPFRSGIKDHDSLFEETCPQNNPEVFHLQNRNQEAEKLLKSNLCEPQTEDSSQISGAQH